MDTEVLKKIIKTSKKELVTEKKVKYKLKAREKIIEKKALKEVKRFSHVYCSNNSFFIWATTIDRASITYEGQNSSFFITKFKRIKRAYFKYLFFANVSR